MTQIQLAYRYEGHDPDDVIEVDKDTARTMIRDGAARHPDVNDSMSVAQLRDVARSRGVDVGHLRSKADLVAALEGGGDASQVSVQTGTTESES